MVLGIFAGHFPQMILSSMVVVFVGFSGVEHSTIIIGGVNGVAALGKLIGLS